MTDLGPNFCGTGANYNDGGTTAWSNPTNIQGDTTSTAATCAPPSNGNTSQRLRASNFGFSGIPAGATITQILVEIERAASNNSRYTDTSVKLLVGGVEAGAEKGLGTAWTTTKAFYSYTWNQAECAAAGATVAAIQAAGFGVSHKGTRTATQAVTASVYRVRITVSYVSAQNYFGQSVVSFVAGFVTNAVCTRFGHPTTLQYSVSYVVTGTVEQILRPDADLDAGGWSTAPLWSKIDESDPGGDTITAVAS